VSWKSCLLQAFVLTLMLAAVSSAVNRQVILLQDESESMEKTDRHDLRSEASAFLIDQMSLAGSGNSLGLVIFGSFPYDSIAPGTSWDAIREMAARGIPATPKTQCFETPDDVHPRGFTDFLGPFRIASRMLSATPDSVDGGAQEKVVILLTDGKLDPWPGAPRFGDAAGQFLQEISGIPCGERYGHVVKGPLHDRFQRLVAPLDKQQIRAEILSRFRERRWRIYGVGFSSHVDTDYLVRLAAETGGEAGLAQDITQLRGILKRTIPPPQNVVVLYASKFCDTHHEQFSLNVDTSAEVLQIAISLSRMMERYHTLPTKGNLEISVTSPGGTAYSSNSGIDMFKWYTDLEGRVHRVTYTSAPSPTPGQWRVSLVGIGSSVCGEAVARARVKWIPRIEATPMAECYPNASSIQLAFWMDDGSGNRVYLENVEAVVQVVGDEKIVDHPLPLNPPSDNRVVTDLTLAYGPGTYRIKAKFHEGVYGREPIPKQIQFKVGCAYQCSAEPSPLDLGALSFTNRRAGAELRIRCTPPGKVALRIVPPMMEHGGAQLPVSWFTVPETVETSEESGTATIRLSCRIPDRFPEELQPGRYAGELVIRSASLQAPVRVPVQLSLALPEIVVTPRTMNFKFWWMVERPQIRRLKIETTVGTEIPIQIRYPQSYLWRTTESAEERVCLEVSPESNVADSGDGLLKAEVSNSSPVEVVFIAKVEDPALRRNHAFGPTTIRPGNYSGRIVVTPSVGADKSIPVKVRVPSSPLILLYRKYGLVLIALAALIALILLRRVLKSRKAGRLEGSTFVLGSGAEKVIHSSIGFSLSLKSTSSDEVVCSMAGLEEYKLEAMTDGDSFEDGDSKLLEPPFQVVITRGGLPLYRLRVASHKGGVTHCRVLRSQEGSVSSEWTKFLILGLGSLILLSLLYQYSLVHI